MKLTQPLILLLCTSVLFACGSTPKSQPTPVSKPTPTSKPRPTLYLKGDFNQWEVKPNYQLERVSPAVYAAPANLQQDKTYEFLFAARDPSQPGGNCGYRQLEYQTLKLNERTHARCTGIVFESFKFTPSATGVFEFFVDFVNAELPVVYVRRVF
jgi:hypothetical protein